MRFWVSEVRVKTVKHVAHLWFKNWYIISCAFLLSTGLTTPLFNSWAILRKLSGSTQASAYLRYAFNTRWIPTSAFKPFGLNKDFISWLPWIADRYLFKDSSKFSLVFLLLLAKFFMKLASLRKAQDKILHTAKKYYSYSGESFLCLSWSARIAAASLNR